MANIGSIRNGKPLRFVFSGVEMGMKWGASTQAFCLQDPCMGIHGEESSKSFRNGDQGSG